MKLSLTALAFGAFAVIAGAANAGGGHFYKGGKVCHWNPYKGHYVCKWNHAHKPYFHGGYKPYKFVKPNKHGHFYVKPHVRYYK